MKASIALVEDDDFTRFTLSSAVRQLEFDVVFETAKPSLALIEIPKKKPDLAVIDLHLGRGPTGIDLAHALRIRMPNLGLLILSSFEDPRLLNSNLPSLPIGSIYLKKSSLSDSAALDRALSRALLLKGGEVGDMAIEATLLSKFSNIQIETLRLMAKGLSNAEIAKRRFVTEKSVEIAIARIAKKLDLPRDSSINQRVHMANVFFRATGHALDDE
jgi:DNA-binding NarL/FixJ family response regulator